MMLLYFFFIILIYFLLEQQMIDHTEAFYFLRSYGIWVYVRQKVYYELGTSIKNVMQ